MNVSNWFFRLAVIAGLVGMSWGVYMGATHDHVTSPAHAHLNLLGWVSMAIFAFFYRAFPQAASSFLAKVHLAVAVIGLLIFIPSLALLLAGVKPYMALAQQGLIVGPLLTWLSMLIFAIVALMTLGKREALPAAAE